MVEENIIKFGISENYVPNWGIVQAIREIYQNFIDYGDFEVVVDKITDTHSCVRITNNFNPESWEFLKIGFSKKVGEAIGKHGEGLKLAGLIFQREKKRFTITNSLGRAKPKIYDDKMLGNCYGLEIDNLPSDKFEIYFEADTKDVKLFEESRISKEDILHTSYYGNIVNKEKGNIYVGGLFVCKTSKLNYAFDFTPSVIPLGRDRDVPSTWDIEYYSNRILNECKDVIIKTNQIFSREFNQGIIPDRVSKRFIPEIDEKGEVISVISGKTIVTDQNLIRKITSNSLVAKRIEKLRYSIQIKKSPFTILSEFKSKINHLGAKDVESFNSILKLSKNWVDKNK